MPVHRTQRTAAKRTAAKRIAAKRTTAKRTAAKRTTAKRAVAKPTVAKRAVAKPTATAKRTVARQPATSVDAFLAKLTHPWRAQIAALRSAILASNTALTERIKWNAPSFCHDGDDRVTFRFPPKGGVQLVFHRGVAPKAAKGFTFEDPSGLLVWVTADRGVVTFTSADDLTAKSPAIARLVGAWIRATTERGASRSGSRARRSSS